MNTQVDGNRREEHEKVTDVHRVRGIAPGVLTQSTVPELKSAFTPSTDFIVWKYLRELMGLLNQFSE